MVLHSDWLGARRAMLRASAAIAIVGLLWVASGWSGGAYMLLGMSIMLTVFSGFENPSATMRHVTLGQAMGVLVALACQWLVWPFASSQAGLVWLMLPFVFVGALLFSHQRTALSGYDCNMVLLLLLQPTTRRRPASAMRWPWGWRWCPGRWPAGLPTDSSCRSPCRDGCRACAP